MTNILDLPPPIVHKICLYLTPFELVRLSKVCSVLRRLTYTLPDNYKKYIQLIVDNLRLGNNLLTSMCFDGKKGFEGLASIMTQNASNQQRLIKMACCPFADQKQCIKAMKSLLKVAKVDQLTIRSSLPRSWHYWISICAAAIKFSNKDVFLNIDLKASEREDESTAHLPLSGLLGHEDTYDVVHRVCVAAFLADLAAIGAKRLSVLYNFEIYTLDIINLHPFKFLGLGFFVPSQNVREHKKNINIFRTFVEDPGWKVDPYDQALRNMAEAFDQSYIGCYMSDEDSGIKSAWETMHKNGYRISWQSAKPSLQHSVIRVMGTCDKRTGKPTVKKMNDKMKKDRTTCSHLVGVQMG